MVDIAADNQENKKIAIVVGIDTYNDDNDTAIPKLFGAENDAKELFELLTSETGGFEKDYKYLLTGRQALQRNILEQVSEIFRQDEPFEIALFYFSGHGFVDKKGELYLSTYDIKKNDPYVGGINASDLRHQIYSSKNKRNALLILDCCYSGTATKGVKDANNNIKNVQPILQQTFGNVQDKNYGSGRFTISSSANDQVSWEISNCKDSYSEDPHVHGEFTYHLLEGIRGGAADETSGEITLLSLKQYINDKLAGNNKQRSYSASSEEETNINAIRIALSIEKFRNYIISIESEIQFFFPQQDPSFPSIAYIIEGAKKLKELKAKNPNNPKIVDFNSIISNKLDKFKDGVIAWCDSLPTDIKILLDKKTNRRDVVDLFSRTVGDLNIDLIDNTGEDLSSFLNLVGNEAKNNTPYKDKNDPKLKTFLMRFDARYKAFASRSSLQ